MTTEEGNFILLLIQRYGAITTEGISILINELREGSVVTQQRDILILINESGGGCSDNRRYFNTN